MTTETTPLPEPESLGEDGFGDDIMGYTKFALRAYGDARAAAARKQALEEAKAMFFGSDIRDTIEALKDKT